MTLKGDRHPGRWYEVVQVYPPGYEDRWEALIQPWGECWAKVQRLVPTEDLKQVPVDLEDFD